MVDKNKRILAGTIILAMSISTITQTSYANEDEIVANNSLAFDSNKDANDGDLNKDYSRDKKNILPLASEDDLENSKKSLKSRIILSGFSDEEKDDYIKQIDAAKNKEDLEVIEVQFYADLQKKDAKSGVNDESSSLDIKETDKDQALDEDLSEKEIDSDSDLAEDPISEERKLVKEQIDEIAAEKGMPAELVGKYYARIDSAKDMDELFNIAIEANEWEKSDAEQPGEESGFKETYKDKIDSLENLSEDQKQVYKDQIDAVDEEADGAEDAIQEIWISAQTQNQGQEVIEDEEELTELRGIAKSVVDELENLSEEEKQAFKNQIDAEKSFTGIDGILDKAKDQNYKNESEKQRLEDLREGYIAKLPTYKNLTDQQRVDYEKQFKEANDEEAMRLIDYDAQLTNKDQEPAEEVSDEDILEDYKALALEEIESLENLTDEKVKEDFINQIKAVKLGQGEDAFINATEAIDTIRAKAAAWKASDNSLDEAKERAKAAINALDKLTEEEKQKYLDLVDKASDKEAINNALGEAKALNDAKSDLEDAKKSANETIANLANLTSDQKEGYLGQIDKADSKEEIDGIVADAKAKDAENLKKAKEDAKASIDELSKINEDKKQSYKEEIDRPSTDTIAKVNEIVNRAKNDSSEGLPEEDALKANKDNYKKIIDSLPSLTDKEKESFKKEIDKSKSLDQIKSIYNEALKLVASINDDGDEDLDYLRNYIIDRINELENLRDSSKEDFIAKVKDANTFESIFDVYRQAIRMDMHANGMIYVPIGYEFIESGYYYRSDLYNNRCELLEVYRDNKITVAAAKILLEHYPNTVKNVKDKLKKLVKESEELQKQAEAMLKEYDEILYLDYRTEI